MSDIIENCEVHNNSASHEVSLTPAGSRRPRVTLRANVDATTGEVSFFVPLDQIDKLRG